MPDPPEKHDENAPPVGEIRFSREFEPNTFVFDPYTASPPRLLDPDAYAATPEKRRPEAPAVERVAHFRILSKIGEGGMGVVYRANDEYLQRLVALKVLNIGKGDEVDVENTQRLLREARAASRINHPNVVTVYAAGEADGVSFIAMEYVEGQDLSKLIGPQGLDTERALEIAARVAEGLGAAHEQEIVHRDIKPANILVCAGDRIKILDFGLAKPGRLPGAGPRLTTTADQLPDSLDALDFYHTQAGVIWGSLRYMSPEQFTSDGVDARSDVFSLGVVLYQMLTGTLPFIAKKPREQLAAVLSHRPPPLRQFRLRIPDAVQVIVDCALAPNQDLRYSDGKAMAAELRTALQRLRELGDVEIEDATAGSTRLATADLRAPAGGGPAADGRAAPPQLRHVACGVDSVTLFAPGAEFDAVIVSPNVYPWVPRGAKLPGSGASGTAVNVLGETYELVAADQQRADLNRYFLTRWVANSIIRRVFDYTPEVVAEHAAASRGRDSETTARPLGSVITSLFGKRRREG